MADTLITNLTGPTVVAATDEFPLNVAGVDRKGTAAELKTFCRTLAPFAPVVYPQWPLNYALATSTLALNNLLYNSDTDVVAWVGTYNGTAGDTIASVKVRTNTLTTSATINCNIEVPVNGKPQADPGVLFAAGATGSQNVAAATTWYTFTMGTPPAMQPGDEFAIVLRVDTAGNTPNFNWAGSPLQAPMSPTVWTSDDGSTFSLATVGLECIVTMTSGGIIYLPALQPVDGAGAYQSIQFDNASISEVAMSLQVPAKQRAIGARMLMGNVAAGADFKFSLWSSTGNEVGEELAQTNTIDGDSMSSTTADGFVERYFTAPYTLDINTTYWLGVRSMANAIAQVGYFNVAAAGDKAAFPLGPLHAQFSFGTRIWDATPTPDAAGVWTTTTTRLLIASLIIDQFVI